MNCQDLRLNSRSSRIDKMMERKLTNPGLAPASAYDFENVTILLKPSASVLHLQQIFPVEGASP